MSPCRRRSTRSSQRTFRLSATPTTSKDDSRPVGYTIRYSSTLMFWCRRNALEWQRVWVGLRGIVDESNSGGPVKDSVPLHNGPPSATPLRRQTDSLPHGSHPTGGG